MMVHFTRHLFISLLATSLGYWHHRAGKRFGNPDPR